MPFDAAFGEFPVLQTERLVLREVVPSDAEALYAIFSDPEAMEYYDTTVFTTLAEAEDLIEHMRSRRASREKVRWGITLRGEDTVIGTVGYVWMVERHNWSEVGYDLVRTHWRQGIMAEALAAVVTFGFEKMGMHRVEALVDAQGGREDFERPCKIEDLDFIEQENTYNSGHAVLSNTQSVDSMGTASHFRVGTINLR